MLEFGVSVEFWDLLGCVREDEMSALSRMGTMMTEFVFGNCTDVAKVLGTFKFIYHFPMSRDDEGVVRLLTRRCRRSTEADRAVRARMREHDSVAKLPSSQP